MENEIEKKEGGKSKVGRPRGVNTVSMSLKLRKEFVPYVRSKGNRNGFINDIIKEKMMSDVQKGLWQIEK